MFCGRVLREMENDVMVSCRTMQWTVEFVKLLHSLEEIECRSY